MHDSADKFNPFRKRLDAFARELGRIHEGDVEALHRARVASRRLRELLPLLEVEPGTARKLSRRLRKVTKRLGMLRELDVLMLTIQEMDQSHRYPQPALKQVSAAVADARAAARERLAVKLPLATLERLAHRLERVASPLTPDDRTRRRQSERRSRHTWVWALEARLAHRAARVKSAIETTSVVYVPERLHDVRIALKKLRYAAELQAEAGHHRATAGISALKNAQDLLGRLHDLEVLADYGRRVQASLSPPDLTARRQLGALVHAVEDDCRQLHARYMHDRTKLIAIARRMGGAKAPAVSVSHQAAGSFTQTRSRP